MKNQRSQCREVDLVSKEAFRGPWTKLPADFWRVLKVVGGYADDVSSRGFKFEREGISERGLSGRAETVNPDADWMTSCHLQDPGRDRTKTRQVHRSAQRTGVQLRAPEGAKRPTSPSAATPCWAALRLLALCQHGKEFGNAHHPERPTAGGAQPEVDREAPTPIDGAGSSRSSGGIRWRALSSSTPNRRFMGGPGPSAIGSRGREVDHIG